jgi:adenine phosphoribosyltransferase
MPIRSRIRTIPDHPKPGILFRDITTLIQDPVGLQLTVQAFAQRYQTKKIDKIVGIESRGFIVGAAVAYQLGVGFVPVRKKGKLPGKTYGQDYELEYGTDRIEIHTDAITPDERVVLIDDLIATGGTASAAAALIRQCGGHLVECAFIVDLPDLGGSRRLESEGMAVFSLTRFDGH